MTARRDYHQHGVVFACGNNQHASLERGAIATRDLRDNVRMLDRAEAEGLDEQAIKTLAICYLYHVNRWTLEQIGAAFGHPKGHISRLLVQGEQHVRELFPELRADELPALDSELPTLDSP